MATKLWVGTDTGNEGDINTAANWLPAIVPVAGEDVYFQDSSQSITENLATLTGVVLGAVHFKKTYTGEIDDGAGGYFEFRCGSLDIGEHHGPGNPSGSGKLLIDIEIGAATVIIHDTKKSTDTGKAAVRLLCVNAATTIEVKKGSVSIADGIVAAGSSLEVSTVGTLTVSYIANISSDATVTIGAGVTLTTLNKYGSIAYLKCAATTVLNTGGTLTTSGSGAITTLHVFGGTVYSNSSGTVTTANISNATINTLQSAIARTFTTVNPNSRGKFIYDNDVVTVTNAFDGNTALTVTGE